MQSYLRSASLRKRSQIAHVRMYRTCMYTLALIKLADIQPQACNDKRVHKHARVIMHTFIP